MTKVKLVKGDAQKAEKRWVENVKPMQKWLKPAFFLMSSRGAGGGTQCSFCDVYVRVATA